MGASARNVMIHPKWAVIDIVTDVTGLPLQFSFPHGMIAAPNFVELMPRHNNVIAQQVHVFSFDAVNITIARTGAAAVAMDPYLRIRASILECLWFEGCVQT